MMIDVEGMKLKDQPVGAPLRMVKPRIIEALVFVAAVAADAREQLLVPAARTADVSNVDERMRSHGARVYFGSVTQQHAHDVEQALGA